MSAATRIPLLIAILAATLRAGTLAARDDTGPTATWRMQQFT